MHYDHTSPEEKAIKAADHGLLSAARAIQEHVEQDGPESIPAHLALRISGAVHIYDVALEALIASLL